MNRIQIREELLRIAETAETIHYRLIRDMAHSFNAKVGFSDAIELNRDRGTLERIRELQRRIEFGPAQISALGANPANPNEVGCDWETVRAIGWLAQEISRREI